MRFQDDTLIAILRKMRTPGGAKLSQKEWQALQATCVDGPKDAAKLHKTEFFPGLLHLVSGEHGLHCSEF